MSDSHMDTLRIFYQYCLERTEEDKSYSKAGLFLKDNQSRIKCIELEIGIWRKSRGIVDKPERFLSSNHREECTLRSESQALFCQ